MIDATPAEIADGDHVDLRAARVLVRPPELGSAADADRPPQRPLHAERVRHSASLSPRARDGALDGAAGLQHTSSRRRARRRRRLPRRRGAARTRGRAAPPRSTAAVRRSARCQPRGCSSSASASSSAGWRTFSPAAPRCIAHPGFAGDHERDRGAHRPGGWRRPCARGSRSTARARARRRHHRRHNRGRRRRSRAAGTRARARRGPRRAPSARGGGGTGSCTTTSRPVSRNASGGCAASHSEKSRTRAENAWRRRGAEQAAVVLHRRAAARAVDDDGRVAGHRRDDPTGETARELHASGVDVQARRNSRRPAPRARVAHLPRASRRAPRDGRRVATRP